MPSPLKRHQTDSLDDPVLPVSKRGKELLSDPMLNKATGFPGSDREASGIRGMVPHQVVSIDDQMSRTMENFRRQENDLDPYSFLEALHDRNDMYIFPGVGMGAVCCKASQVTDRMFYAAARTLAAQVGEDSPGVGRLYPDLALIREISTHIAVAVCEVAYDEGLAGIERPEDLEGHVRRRMFQPSYVPYAPA